jgi:DNA-binding NarL/FixJ family response regulator
MFQISTALTALNLSLNNQVMLPLLNHLKIHVSNKLSINTKEGVLAEIETSKPNFLFISSNLPGIVKLEEVITKTKQASPKTKVVLVVCDGEQSKVMGYLTSNADAIIYAENIPDSLEYAIRQINKGQPFICGMSAQALRNTVTVEKADSTITPGLLNLLTDREAEVLHSLTQGVNYKQISKMLFISESTVKTHINNIFTKLNVNDRTQAVLYALRHGIESVVKNPNILNSVTSALSEIER